MSILITGGSGFLGKSLLRECQSQGKEAVVISHSEIRDQEIKIKYPKVKSYCMDISTNIDILDRVVSQHNIEYIIHCAAMKHIGICEKNPTKAIEVNIHGSKNVIDVAKKNKVNNVIAISTDKAIGPSCVYGSTKFLMEKIMLENGFSIIQGVNFFFSHGSVLELWDQCVTNKSSIKVNTNNTVRYFVDIQDVSKKILDNLETKSSYINLDRCYRITLHDLAKAFCEYHNYYEMEDYVSISAEKIVEEIPEEIKDIYEPNMEELKLIIDNHYKD